MSSANLVSFFSDRELEALNHVGHCHWILVAQVVDLVTACDTAWDEMLSAGLCIFQRVIPQPAMRSVIILTHCLSQGLRVNVLRYTKLLLISGLSNLDSLQFVSHR